MDNVFIGLGSNLGNRKKNLETAIKKINFIPEIQIEKKSSIIKTKPDNAPGPNYLNCIIKINTTLSPTELLYQLNNIEEILGRKRIFKNAPRTIDLDILLYGNKTIKTKELTIPHPGIRLREFVKKSLFEIEPALEDEFK